MCVYVGQVEVCNGSIIKTYVPVCILRVTTKKELFIVPM